jgi:DDE family transposase
MEPELIRQRYALLAPLLDERRLWLDVAAEALVLGYGGTALTSQATEVSRPPITVGCKDLLAAGQSQPLPAAAGCSRQPGGGRTRRVEADAMLRADMERLIDPVTRGDPESPWRWTSKRVRKLADERHKVGHQTSHRMVAALLQEMDDSLQANRKTLERRSHPDRDAQV